MNNSSKSTGTVDAHPPRRDKSFSALVNAATNAVHSLQDAPIPRAVPRERQQHLFPYTRVHRVCAAAKQPHVTATVATAAAAGDTRRSTVPVPPPPPDVWVCKRASGAVRVWRAPCVSCHSARRAARGLSPAAVWATVRFGFRFPAADGGFSTLEPKQQHSQRTTLFGLSAASSGGVSGRVVRRALWTESVPPAVAPVLLVLHFP
jgi:hypothetical protein